MQIVIEILNKDIPKHQEVIDIRLHFIDGHIVDADGYGFAELPKGHGRLIDADDAKREWQNILDCEVEHPRYQCTIRDVLEDAKTIIEADTESEEV